MPRPEPGAALAHSGRSRGTGSAADIATMHGPFRIPTLLKGVDGACRMAG
jgi:hypothetical protein